MSDLGLWWIEWRSEALKATHRCRRRRHSAATLQPSPSLSPQPAMNPPCTATYRQTVVQWPATDHYEQQIPWHLGYIVHSFHLKTREEGTKLRCALCKWTATSLIRDFAYCDRCYRTVCFSVRLSLTFVHCAQTAEDIDTVSFAYDSHIPATSQIVLKFGLQRSTTLSPSWPTPGERQRHSM